MTLPSQPEIPASALVVAAHGRRGLLEIDGQRRPFMIQGRELRVVCGDRVQVELRPGSEDLLVTGIAARTNVLARQQQRADHRDIIAANLSQVIAVCAPRPEPDLFLLDRYLCAAEMMGCRAAVLWNKSDLGLPPPGLAGEFQGLGYPVLSVSTRTGAGLDALTDLLRNQVSVLVGQSGVGKSSLVNAIAPGVAAAVGALSPGRDMGTHTTTAVLMYPVAGSGRLLDAPGVRDFVPALNPGSRLDTGFADIRPLAASCRFANCQHTHEPGCRVKEAVAAGALSRRRYESYLQLLELMERPQPHAPR